MTKKQRKKATIRLLEIAKEAQDIIQSLAGSGRDADIYIAGHAIDTLADRAEKLRVSNLTTAEYEAELAKL